MNLPSPITELYHPLFEENDIKVLLKRDDLIHPIISGNKWRKLKFNVEKYKALNATAILTFGGAYSNHIAACAELCADVKIPSIGIIRGDELNENSNETLKAAAKNGMKLIFTSREEYALREEKYYHEELRRRHGHVFIVPEGGANYYGVLGCTEIMKEVEQDVDYVFCAAGTATTVSGILLSTEAQVRAVSALKGGTFLADNVRMRLREFGYENDEIAESMANFELLDDFHHGGYAKHTAELIEFMKEFRESCKVELDYVYTAKMMSALFSQIKKGKVKKNSTVLAVHTGGLQGNKTISSLLA
jgi:1-aminocyclopropane-1-carboxylate deaminase/D-cysteine desulfhydrase-like pyridoxal-dependent ACC family enzyme